MSPRIQHTLRWAALVGVLAVFAALGASATALAASGTQDLYKDERLTTDQYLTSDYGRYRLIMQGDGNLVLYGEENRALWSAAGTYGHPGAWAIMQLDGNFVVYSATNQPLWATGTFGGGSRLHLGEGGNLSVINGSGATIWQTGTVHDNSDTWNPAGFAKTHDCVSLKNSPASVLFAGGGAVGSSYKWSNSQLPEPSVCTPAKPVWVDAQEVLTTSESTPRRLYFVHGGPGSVPYGHLWIGDMNSPAPTPHTSGPPEAGSQGAGKGCTPQAGDPLYTIKIDPSGTPDAIPDNWQYKVGQTGSTYHKYQSAGESQGSLMPGPALYGYLTWTWVMRRNRDDTPTANQNPWKMPDQWGNDRVTNTGGGVVRSLIKEGQPFYRCGQVESINGLAWAPLAMSTDPPVGRVTVIYGKTRPGSTAPWLYGWAVYSHQVRTGLNPDGSYAWGPRRYHVH